MSTEDESVVLIKAAARVLMDSVLILLQRDPHHWSERGCPTCKAISGIIGRHFGCYVYAHERQLEREAKKNQP